jgi:pimeloyl-ACP methyl ester carboxylesterase
VVASVAVYEPVLFGVIRSEHDAEALADVQRLEAPIFTNDELGGSDPWFEAFVDYWNGPGAWARMPAAMKAGFLAGGRMVYRETRALARDTTPTSAYAAITAPTLLLTGERSPAFARRVVHHLGRVITGSSTHVVEGAGHMGPLTHADEVNAAIAAHLGG